MDVKSLAFFKLLILIALLTTPLLADQWEFFFAESVIKYGCRVQLASIQIAGSPEKHDMWTAEAFAERDHEDIGRTWSYTVAEYPNTVKGRHKALAACSKWQDEAERRVNKAHGR